MYPHQSTISDSYRCRRNICCWTKALRPKHLRFVK